MSPFNLQLVAILVFLITYALMATEYRERTIAAMTGAGAVWALGILSPEEMVSYVDLHAIGLLFGMMVIIGALREAKFFRWISGYVAKWSHGSPRLLLVAFIVLTALLSAVLDNVTTVLFMVTVTVDLAETAEFNPKPYILSEIFASNIGGTATLIGDPPNIMIASATGFTFGDFVSNVAPISVAALAVGLLYTRRKFSKELRGYRVRVPDISQRVTERRLMWTGLGTLVGAIILLFLQDATGMSPATVALAAATILLFAGGPKMPQILREVEWSTLLFFGSLFVIVGALEKTGWMALISQGLGSVIGDNTILGVTAVLWLSSLVSAFIDNIPFSAAFIPVLSSLDASRIDVYPLWWALSAGTGLGGNGTMIGASANIIAVGIARARGVKISFMEFTKIGMVLLILTTTVANLVLLAMFWR